MYPGKRWAGEANHFVAIATETSVPCTLGVERPRTYPRRPPDKGKAERARKKGRSRAV